jgi:hypothetical protein
VKFMKFLNVKVVGKVEMQSNQMTTNMNSVIRFLLAEMESSCIGELEITEDNCGEMSTESDSNGSFLTFMIFVAVCMQTNP